MTDYESQLRSLECKVDRLANDTRDLRSLVAQLKDQLRSGATGGGGGGSGFLPVVVKAYGAISARSGTTWGTGSAYSVDDSGATDLSDTATVGAVRNLLNKTIASGTRCIAVPTAPDRWWIVAVDNCTTLS
jgi:hypothetical protein